MVQIQMIRSKFSQNLNRCYQEYIEYFNEQQFTPITISLLFIFQSLFISCAILSKISSEEPFLSLSILGGHHLLTALGSLSQPMKITIAASMLCFLIVPFSVPFHLIYESLRKEYIRAGEFKKKCDFSLFHSFIRGYLITFQYLFLPLLLFYFISLQTVAFTASICTFSIFLIILVDYHIIQMIYKEGHRIIKLTFPYKLIDTALYIATIFIANNQNYNLCMVGVFMGNLGRMLLSLFLHFYSRSVMKIHQFYLIFNQIVLSGLMIAYYSQKPEFVLYNVLLLSIIIFLKRQKIMELIESCQKKEDKQQMVNEEEQYFQQSLKNNQLSSLQLQFQKQGNFAGIFRRLIMMGKKSTDNRQYLLIQVLKSKCYGIEISSRGTAAKIMDCQTVMQYESLLKEIVCLALEISNRTISILKLMKMRDESIYIFNQEVQVLITYVEKMKNLVRQLMKINQWSLEGQFILNMMFAHIMHEEDFLEQVKALKKINRKQSDKQLKVHLFNQKTVMVFLNMLDQLGKIVKTSKNLPTILGYNPNELQGIQIDNLLLSSMKNYHIQHVTNFIDSYDKVRALNPRSVLFYINNNNYELQKVDVGYNFVMSSFNIFQMCGIINKVEFDGDVIILNKIGNIQGFTKKIGNELGLNLVAGPQMSKYNILSLMPALLKYGDKAVRIKTIIFKVKNMQSNVWKLEQHQKASIGRSQITNRNYQIFLKLLQDDIVDAYLSDIDVNYVSFFSNQVVFTVIQIKSYQKIINFCQIKQKIQTSFKNNAIEQQTEMRAFNQTDGIMSLNQEEHKNFDTNFTLDAQRHSMVKMRQIQTGQQQINEQRSFQVMAMLKSQEEGPTQKYQRQSNYVSRGNKVKIQRNWQCADVLVLLILSFVIVIGLDYVDLNSKVDQMQKFNKKLINNNKALSIILKSLYHANFEDIDSFSNNNLLNTYSALINYNFNYTTFYNSTIIYNHYHLFNVHIPSLLKNLLSKNTTIASHSTIQLNLNINQIIIEADRAFKQILKSWGDKADQVSLKFKLVLVFIVLTAFSVIIIAMFMVYYRRKQLVTYEAFFRFEKEELQQKITDIKTKIKQLQTHVMKWYLLKQFHNYIKEGDIFNLEFQSINAIYQPKVGFQVSSEKEQSIKNGEMHKYIIYILVFALFQGLLCLLYATQNSSFIHSLTNIPRQIDFCSKSMISTPFLLASINRTTPTNIMEEYINATERCISQKINSLPNLLDFSASAPCSTCTILYPYLATNYLSYFNSFEEMVGIYKAGFHNENNYTQMIQSASIFSRNLQEQLYLWQNISPSVLATVFYLLSAFLILLFMFINILRINKEIRNVEVFLQFFSKEMIENNMRMVNLLVKNQ